MTTQTSQAERKVPTRRISFEASLEDLPRHFAADEDLIMSHLIAGLSAAFPGGEDGFVRSVRNYRDQITDPDLRRQVAGFIGQESTHGREHRAVNQKLEELGYPTKKVERVIDRLTKARERFASPEMCLANTAAAEHLTATFAEIALTDEEARRLPGGLSDLLLWHALEEAEHKAVAFDVFRAIGGSERTRVKAMNILTATFIIGTTLQVVLSMLRDSATYRRGNLRASLARLRRSPFMRREVWERLRDYNREGFHPDDYNTDELVQRWDDELFGEQGSLKDRLVTKKAA